MEPLYRRHTVNTGLWFLAQQRYTTQLDDAFLKSPYYKKVIGPFQRKQILATGHLPILNEPVPKKFLIRYFL